MNSLQVLKDLLWSRPPLSEGPVNIYERLIETWGGVPDHLKANFARYISPHCGNGAPEVDLSGGSGQIAAAVWNQFDADTLVERGVLVAGDPESCLKAISLLSLLVSMSCSS